MTTVYRNRWLEVAFPSHNLGYESLSVGLARLGLYFKLPKFLRGETMEEQYGFYFGDDALVLCWNRRTKFLHYPWSIKHVRREEWVERECYGQMKGGWAAVPEGFEHGVIATSETWDWAYTLRSGKVQNRTVTAYRSRGVYRRRWLPAWLPLFQRVHHTGSFEFSGETGEGEGSWKGGCLGISAPMLNGETLPQMLDRLAKGGSFNR